MRVIITAELDASVWGTDEELADMTDKEVVELLYEDILEVLSGSTMRIEREPAGTTGGGEA